MSGRRQKVSPLESFKNSLRYSLGPQLTGMNLRKIQDGEFHCSAPLEELGDEKTPLLLELLLDIETNPPKWTRIWFELEFVRINRMDMTAIYRATCDQID